MKTITAKQAQTIYDIALEHYGNVEAAAEIMHNNPELVNDPAELAALGINVLADDGFYMDVAVLPGASVNIDNDSELMRPNILKELTEDVTTFNL